jgi:hypothetical protein
MSEQATANANVAAASGDRELTDDELDKVAGGFGWFGELIRKAGKPQPYSNGNTGNPGNATNTTSNHGNVGNAG